jgi:gamma-glutamyltranspeptidase
VPSSGSSSSDRTTPKPGAGYVQAQRGAVATENGLCSDIGATVLRDLGGSASALPHVTPSLSLFLCPN